MRPVEVLPVQSRGTEMICLRDPSRIAPQPLFLSPSATVVLSMFSGENDLRDIQAVLMRKFGELVNLEVIEGLVQTLDENLFLEGEGFERFLARRKEEFSAASSRPALLAGQAYPGEPAALAEALAAFDSHPSGPGETETMAPSGVPRGLVAPHIDFERGGPCYAWAYRQLRPEESPGLVVILGTAHSPVENFLVLCSKDFETPFGPARCDRELADELSARVGPGLTADEFAHYGEHSVEFQAVWLMSLFSQAGDMRILPLLCGPFHPLIAEGQGPGDSQEYEAALLPLKDLLGRYDRAKVMVLASADLSHVGPQFGHDFRVTPAVQADVRAHDLAALEAAAQGDFQGFYGRVARERDRTNICGLAPIYTMLRLLDGQAGRLLAYDQWTDKNGQGLVSFASLVFP